MPGCANIFKRQGQDGAAVTKHLLGKGPVIAFKMAQKTRLGAVEAFFDPIAVLRNTAHFAGKVQAGTDKGHIQRQRYRQHNVNGFDVFQHGGLL